jgi:hypothetical protein
VIGGAQGEVADEADDGLDERPARRRMEEAHDGGDAALQANGVLRHFALWMPRRQMAERAHRRLRYLLPAELKHTLAHLPMFGEMIQH